MTDERIIQPAQPVQCDTSATPAVTPQPITRRMVLRGASAAVPTILTLQSGAALANASNGWTGGATTTGGDPRYTLDVDGQNSYVCLATDGTQSGPYRLPNPEGNPATVIPAGVEFTDPDGPPSAKKVFGDDMCLRGETFEINLGANDKRTVYVRKGMLMSAGAYSSLAAAGVIDPIDVFKTNI